MKYLSAYALLSLGGNNNISAADIKRVLGDAQVNAEDAEINRLLEAVRGKPVHELIAQGVKQIGTAAPAPSGAPAKVDAPTQKKEEPKKAEKKKEAPPEEEEDDFMAGGLFD